MALDQALLESACATHFTPTLRFYRWSPPALSIGRFQSLGDIDLESCAAEGIEVVRRPTGGRSILHLDDFTYSIAIPRAFQLPDSVVEAYGMICGGILRALEHLGVHAALQPGSNTDYRTTGGACFSASTPADLEYHGRKLCGSAQVRREGALLQHGSILLKDRSGLLFRLLHFENEEERRAQHRTYKQRCIALEETGCRCEWSELEESFLRGFSEFFEVEICESPLTPWENERWSVLTAAYLSRPWLANADLRPLPS